MNLIKSYHERTLDDSEIYKVLKTLSNLGFLSTDVVKGESTLAVVQQPEVLVCLGNGDHV